MVDHNPCNSAKFSDVQRTVAPIQCNPLGQYVRQHLARATNRLWKEVWRNLPVDGCMASVL